MQNYGWGFRFQCCRSKVNFESFTTLTQLEDSYAGFGALLLWAPFQNPFPSKKAKKLMREELRAAAQHPLQRHFYTLIFDWKRAPVAWRGLPSAFTGS